MLISRCNARDRLRFTWIENPLLCDGYVRHAYLACEQATSIVLDEKLCDPVVEADAARAQSALPWRD